MILSLIIVTMPTPAWSAENIGTDTLIEESVQAAERALVYEFMSREEVQQEMISLGVDPDEAMNRLDTLTDSEIQQIAGEIQTMPAGEGALETVLGVALVVFVILLITDFMCLTNVFKFAPCAG
jgi:hypothetical protein